MNSGSDGFSVVKILTAAIPLCCGVGFGVSTFMFIAEPNTTQIYVELQNPVEDGLCFRDENYSWLY